jgi:hypothetical protein
MAGGRPSKLTPLIQEQVYNFALIGLTDAKMAEAWGVAESTLNLWKKNKQFSESLRKGKAESDGEVVQSLFQKAKGGDTVACIYWLKNRQPAYWRDKQETEVSASGPFLELLMDAQHKPKKA